MLRETKPFIYSNLELLWRDSLLTISMDLAFLMPMTYPKSKSVQNGIELD